MKRGEKSLQISFDLRRLEVFSSQKQNLNIYVQVLLLRYIKNRANMRSRMQRIFVRFCKEQTLTYRLGVEIHEE